MIGRAALTLRAGADATCGRSADAPTAADASFETVATPGTAGRAERPAAASPPTRPSPSRSTSAPSDETVVSAAQPASAPRADQAAAASVVAPDDSPRAYDDLALAARRGPGRQRRAHRLDRQVDHDHAARLEPRSGAHLLRRRADQHRGRRRRRHLDAADRRRRARRGLPRQLAARVRRVGAGRDRLDHDAHARRRRAAARSGVGSFGTMFGDVTRRRARRPAAALRRRARALGARRLSATSTTTAPRSTPPTT